MRSNYLKAALKNAVLAVTILFVTAGVSSAQVNLTAARQTAVLPDGASVPMWGWVCGTGTPVTAGGTGTAAAVGGATCTATNGVAQALGTPSSTTNLTGSISTTWQPPLIIVPYIGATTSLSITLTNSLPVETSLVIVGQLPGGTLGTPVREAGPRTNGAHAGQSTATWPIAGLSPDRFTPPAQGARARSFVTEAAAGGSQTYTWAALKPGTYLIQTGTYLSIQGPMGLYGVLVVTTAPITGTPGTAYTVGTAGINYDADATLLLSEIDPKQNAAADAAAVVAGFDETKPWTPTCGGTTPPTCYPAAVNYTPLYYLVNGVAFSKNAPAASAITIPGTVTTVGGGNVLLRFVNAGSRMHVPTAVGLNFSLIAEDGNVQPDVALGITKYPTVPPSPKVQSEVFLAAGKVFDVFVKPAVVGTALAGATYAVFDRSLDVSTNNQRDGGMQAYLVVGTGNIALGTGGVPTAGVATTGAATYFCAPGVTLNVTDPGQGVVAKGTNVYGVTLTGNPANNTIAFGGGTLTLNPNGTFTYAQPATNTTTCGGSFTYYVNGNTTITGTVNVNLSPTFASVPTANPDSYTCAVSSTLKIKRPGVLANDTDPHNYQLTAVLNANTCGPVTLNSDGSFTATAAAPGTNCSFTYHAVNSENKSSGIVAVSLTFPKGNGPVVTVQDARSKAAISDYKWIIEQDLTFNVDPACQQNGTGGSKPATCPALPPILGNNFHTSYMPVIAVGCTGPQSCERDQTVYNPLTGTHDRAVCDNGICTPGASLPISTPDQAVLIATNPDGTPGRYFISVLPGDAANAFNTANSSDPAVAANCVAAQTPVGGPGGAGETVPSCGHTIGGAPIPAPTVSGTTTTFAPVTVNVEPNPLPTSTVTVYVFEDDFPLNGEPDTGGGVDTMATNEVPLGDFQVVLWDDAGSSGDATGQMHHDMFNMPLTNSLNGTIDPATGLNACPISNTAADPSSGQQIAVGVIIVCPKFESDGKTLSALTGQAVIKNLMPGRFGVVVHPGAAREAAGEEWLQTNTLGGTHFQDTFVRASEPAYFQEFGPGGYHVFFGMANPKIINARKTALCKTNTTCHNTVNGQVTNLHMSRPPNESLSDSNVFGLHNPANNAALSYTTCYASLGDSDGETIAFTKCDQNGNFTFTGIPDGNWGIVVFDQWLDLIVDGSSKAINVSGGHTYNIDYSAFTWQTHIWSNTYMDVNGNGIHDPGEPPIASVPSRVRFRNGKFNNTLFSDASGNASFNETFPLFNWYVTESDTTRFRGTGVHFVYDAGGQNDGPTGLGNGNLSSYQGVLSSKETVILPANLRVSGTVYCASADCPGGIGAGSSSAPSTGRIDPGNVVAEGVQGFIGQTAILDWGKQPYAAGETGGIRGHVVYSSTRPFDDPGQLFQNLWEPLVPNVTINLYKEGTTPEGTTSLTLVDTTTTSSWDKWAQGFRADGVTPNMNCPGQPTTDPFFNYTLAGSRNYLNPGTALPSNSQFKCYDGMHVFNQVQPAPYDGLYQFPSAKCQTVGATFTISGNTNTYSCAVVTNPAFNASINGHPQTGAAPVVLPPGKYVAEVVVPPGYELTKEEDKNILIGDMFIASVTQQFAGLGDVFIIPDQATINNGNPAFGTGGGATNPTTDFGRSDIGGFGPGGLIVMPAACVGTLRVVPDYMSISPESGEVAPFAGASRNLCDRKELTLEDQMQAQADFFVWTKTPAASHFAGFILDDLSSEFDPASPTFGEKFAVPNSPISIKSFNGVEISRVYSDQWGIYNGLTYSTWDVNPPNPTGYAPNMMITCMNDPGPIVDKRPGSPTLGQIITDPLYNPAFSNFCYENTLMPADTASLDTPVVPVSAFAEAYNPPDCAYPDATPAILRVDGDGPGPYVSGTGNAHSLTITALGNQLVPNHAYSGPAASTAPYNQKFITRHYGFGTAAGTVTITNRQGNPVALGGVTWADGTIKGFVPSGVCPPPQLSAGGCSGQLVITAANGKQSIDTVTVTVGGKAPTYVNGENATNNAIQTALDAATPGDLIIVNGSFSPSATAPAGTTCAGVTLATATCIPTAASYPELLLMWKPVRLQGVGAAAVIIDANTHPAGKLQPWRQKVNCLFGLALNGGLSTGTTGSNPFDPTGAATCDSTMQNAVQGIPLEAVVGWDASLNGNIAELLQEPTLMGAYEGAGITVLGKGIKNPNTAGICDSLNATGCILITGSAADCAAYPNNFYCHPSRIDGMSFTGSSQGGGGVYLHGFNHNMEVSNLRIHSNGGTLSGGLIVGQMEVPDGAIDAANNQLPYLYNTNVNVHNNAITMNAAYGDELNSSTPASAGGVTFCAGDDYYKFKYNWVCGNMSTGDGGGFAHNGFSWNADIEHNSFLFNQSFNSTLTTHGGGVILQGGGPDGAACENAGIDMDCPPALSDGVGPGLVFNANLVQGNTAESGNGGGLRLQNVNGTDVQRNPRSPGKCHEVDVTNNIIVDNVAGWTGGGVSLQDAVRVEFINNTVVSNDSTATAGVLFNTLGAPLANVPPPGCDPTTNPNCTGFSVISSTNQPAGFAIMHNTVNLTSAFPTTASQVVCPSGHPNCKNFSTPVLDNNIIYQNRAFHIGQVGGNPVPGANQVVTLTPQLNQMGTGTGSCPSGASYWDIGAYGDSGPGNTSSGLAHGSTGLNPVYSILTSTAGYSSTNKAPASAGVVHQYCNGSRVPPEIAPLICTSNANAPGCANGGSTGGVGVPTGVPDINPFYPLFTLNPAVTVDEGNNFINMFYGPLSLSNATTYTAPGTVLAPLGDYTLVAGSPAIDGVPRNASGGAFAAAPSTDFFGHARPDPANPNAVDIGAVEFAATTGGGGGGGGQGTFSVTSATNGTLTTVVGVRTLTFIIPTPRAAVTSVVTVTNSGTGPLQITAENLLVNIGGLYSVPAALNTCSFTTPLAAGGTCTFSVTYATPAARPGFPDIGALAVVNDGSGTMGGSTPLALVAQ